MGKIFWVILLPERIFIDTNLIVNQIILSQIELQRKEKRKELYKEYRKLISSKDLIEQISRNKNKNFEFYTSNLAIAEIFFVLRDEYRCRKMHKDGVPFRTWKRIDKSKRFPLTKTDIKEIESEIRAFIYYFCEGKEFPVESRIRIIKEEYDTDIISDLTLCSGIETHDAILICTALKKNCGYFCTSDFRIELEEIKKMKICPPEKIMQLLNKNK